MAFVGLPIGCPPADATSCVGEVYRLVASVPPTDADFSSHYDKFPLKEWADECEARGLSVFLSYEAAVKLRRRFKGMKALKIAVGSLTPGLGLIKQTGNSPEHHTWWPDSSVIAPSLFTLHTAETI